ncbi:hypothetical protein DRZ78_01760 [Candidatus Aerophobetes bacterium]|uniref:Uncharacterized protein n=1 Tax=Aerophobetes bacterium TaxID=2030807 RepID=A0A662D4Z6_UNCAE|nr:MAG: hypothetical protein DRZ78_01760 [Candidatus Aerophobetes bacterium]
MIEKQEIETLLNIAKKRLENTRMREYWEGYVEALESVLNSKKDKVKNYNAKIKFNLSSGRGELYYKNKYIMQVNLSGIEKGEWLKTLRALARLKI